MGLRTKKVKGKEYYYLELSYLVVDKSKKFSKYIGSKKPSAPKLEAIESNFKENLIKKLSGNGYSVKFISKDDLIKVLLFRGAFNKKFASLSPTKRRKFEVDRTVLFTLTTLTTEDVDVDLKDVQEAQKKKSKLSLREQISKNMLKGIEIIKKNDILSKSYLLDLHKTIMANFETKTPGKLRQKQVYLQKADAQNPLGAEIAYRPPHFNLVKDMIEEFVKQHNASNLNPIEKAALAHYNIYRIHPFLDGNKRICRLIFNKSLLNEGFPLLNISERKEDYFKALINSVENNNPQNLADFALKEYFRQIKEFLKK